MNSVIGKSFPLIDSGEKVAGKLVYGSDFSLNGMLYGAVLRSPIAHGRIANINTSRQNNFLRSGQY